MDISEQIARLKARSSAQWIGLANRVLPTAATAVLVLAIAWSLAELTWRAAPGRAPDAPLPEIATSPGAAASPSRPRSFASLADSHLFGEAPAPEDRPAPVEPAVDAPETTLNLQLTGIVEVTDAAAGAQPSGDAEDAQPSSGAEEWGIAIIASGRDNEKAYGVGDTIENASGARLHAVYADRVLLERNGQLEALRLPKEAAPVPRTAAARPEPAPEPADQGSMRTTIQENATRLSDIIRLAPHVEGGEMIGFRVNPGRDRETFAALGLQPGDVVTDVNGMVVDDPGRALQVYEALEEATSANVTIMRDGSPQVVVIDTEQLESLADNRQ